MNSIKKIYHMLTQSMIGYWVKYLLWLFSNIGTLVFKDYYVLVGTPQHGNLGDQAIALAEYQLFDVCGKNKAIVEIPSEVMSRAVFLRPWVGKRDIFINGGGFIGSLWIGEERMIRSVLNSYQENRVIILPQTITFEDSEWGRKVKEESIEIYNRHKNLIICAREQKSYELGKQIFPNAKILRVPDMVLSYKLTEAFEENRRGAVMCMRSDCEKALSDLDNQRIEAVLRRFYGDEIQHTDTVLEHKVQKQQRSLYVNEKLKQFAAARLVVTDRLHGMVFAALVGTPCIALGNTNGKVKGIYQWIEKFDYVRYIECVDGMEEIVPQLMNLTKCQYDNRHLVEMYEELKELI